MKLVVCSKVDKPVNMNIHCDGNFRIDLEVMDEDHGDEKARASVSSAPQGYELTGQLLNDQEKNTREFERSRSEENQGLLRSRTFEVVETDDISEGMYIFGSQYVDIIKPANVRAPHESILNKKLWRKRSHVDLH